MGTLIDSSVLIAGERGQLDLQTPVQARTLRTGDKRLYNAVKNELDWVHLLGQ